MQRNIEYYRKLSKIRNIDKNMKKLRAMKKVIYSEHIDNCREIERYVEKIQKYCRTYRKNCREIQEEIQIKYKILQRNAEKNIDKLKEIQSNIENSIV